MTTSCPSCGQYRETGSLITQDGTRLERPLCAFCAEVAAGFDDGNSEIEEAAYGAPRDVSDEFKRVFG